MGTVMKDLHLQEACPSELCSISQFTWWLRLQLTNKTMRSALHQLPLCISFSDVWRVNPVPSSKHDSQAWELLLLCCTYPIATLRYACLRLNCRRVLCCGVDLGSCWVGPAAVVEIKCLTGLGEQRA